MFRGLAWIAKLVAAGLIISFLSIWTTGYIVTSYVETILKQYELPIEVPPMAMSGVWGKLWGSDPHTTAEESGVESASGVEGGSEANGDSEDLAAENSGSAEDDGAQEAFGQIEEPPLTDVGVGKGSGAAGGVEPPEGGGTGAEGENGGDVADGGTLEGIGGSDGVDGTETALTTDELTETKDKISDEDKNKLFELLMAKLPQESLQQISAYMEEGLTERELTNIQQIMAQHLDKKEYEDMMSILKKY
ncbi:hypothetical protein [Paenibacillus agaridevorans]|uniref:hypothetical protein n=1 Tax=Paenibacillus agaridevorans TaxID=171404 RepID=UPI001BE41B62|nr:hypothetical protein [Paenibacillus agaridevorans]